MISMDVSCSNVRKFESWCTENERPFELIAGVRVDTLESVKEHITPYGYYVMKNWRESCAHFDTLGPIGCFLAHRNAWKQCIKSTAEHSWIFEEGVSRYDDDKIRLLENEYNQFDLIHGHSIQVVRLWKQRPIGLSPNENTDAYKDMMVPFSKIYYGTKCYRVSRRFARRLLEKSEQFDVHVDTFLSIMAIYYNDEFLTGHVKCAVVNGASSKKIDHSIDRNLLLPITTITIIIICIMCIIVLNHYYKKCRRSQKDD
jgi:GR25 family glycosyltransferase involved in LPS biosynthesis